VDYKLPLVFLGLPSENAGKSMAARRATGDETRKTFLLFILVLTLSFLLFTVPNVERVFTRINIQL